MEITLTFGIWLIPTIITVVAIIWAFWAGQDDGGWLSGIGVFFMMVPALFVALLSWIAYAVMK